MSSKYLYTDISKTGPNLTNVNAALEGVRNIIHTRVGEIPHNRLFGSRVEDFLFEPYSFVVSRLIFTELKYSILKWNPQIEEVLGVSSVNADPDTRSYPIYLLLKVKGFDQPVEYTESLLSKESN